MIWVGGINKSYSSVLSKYVCKFQILSYEFCPPFFSYCNHNHLCVRLEFYVTNNWKLKLQIMWQCCFEWVNTSLQLNPFIFTHFCPLSFENKQKKKLKLSQILNCIQVWPLTKPLHHLNIMLLVLLLRLVSFVASKQVFYQKVLSCSTPSKWLKQCNRLEIDFIASALLLTR